MGTGVFVAVAIAASAWWLLRVAATPDGRVNAIRGALTAGAAAGAGMGLVLAFLRQRYHEIDATEQRITGRYTAAIDQLGSDKLEVRIGGIYALGRIARDSPADQATVRDVLSALVREHTGRTDGGLRPRGTRVAADVQASLSVLGRAEMMNSPDARLDLSHSSLEDADLAGARLHGVKLFGARLHDADLSGADLREADLTGTTLLGTNFTGADLTGALLDATVRGTDTQWPEGFTPPPAVA